MAVREEASAASREATNQKPAGARRVLIVEDDRRTAEALKILLTSEGFQPTIFYNGTETMRSIGRDSFDAALVDVHLPDMSGLVLSQRLREKLGEKIPIVVVSGDTSMETLNSLSHVGATYFLAKPVSPQLLLGQLRAHVDGDFKAGECD